MAKKLRQKVELDIESIGLNGVSVARLDGLVYMVRGGLPGDKIIAQITRSKKKYKEARLVEVLEPTQDRVPAICEHFGDCGGCRWQDMIYDKQLFWKEQHIRDAFQRIGKVEVGEYLPIMPSEKVFNYRNKMEFSFGAARWLTQEEVDSDWELNRDFALGLHAPGRFDRVLDVKTCHIHNDFGNIVLNKIRDKAVELGTRPYDSKEQSGFLRNLIIRSNKKNELMIVLVTKAFRAEEDHKFIDWYSKYFIKDLDFVVTHMQSINDEISPVAYGEPVIFSGNGILKENILDVEYTISPFSFFQTNSHTLNIFISKIIESADLSSEQTVWDLYCGTGSITLPAAKKCKEIIGIELFDGSVADAKKNSEENGIENVSFYCEDLHKKQIPEMLMQLPRPDRIIIDPPRAGMHKYLVEHLLEVEVPMITYVSCNPTTQARDCELLAEKYEVVSLQGVDMFPHTFHIESIAVLKLKEN
jgi:23S rRNA (uracil1939-C5)-methyltransferase